MSRREALPPIDEVFCFMEIWKDIPNYEGYYQVSNLGNVKRLDRMIKHTSGGLMFVKGRVLKQCRATNGYLALSLSKDGCIKQINTHRLVAMAFLGHISTGSILVVDHINNVKTDNRLENLQILTQRENSNKYTEKYKRTLSSKYTGVSWKKCIKKWCSRININNKSITLGYFNNEIDAHNAYQNALKQLQNASK